METHHITKRAPFLLLLTDTASSSRMRAETHKNDTNKRGTTMAKKNKPRAYTRMTAELFKTALDGSFGNITVMAQRAGSSRDAIYDWIKNHPEAAEQIRKEREQLVDLAENQLGRLIQERNATAIIFTLKTLGKNRGYVEQFQLANPDGSNIVPPKIIVKDKEGADTVHAILEGD